MDINFKKGVYQLNQQSNFDFQLNRLIMWDGGNLKEVQKIAHKINRSEDWKKELVALGDTAIKENRTENAIAYYRMSEFFMYDGDPDKKKYYQKATEMFYDFYKEYFASGKVTQYKVAYEDVFLPVMYVKALGDKKDTILLHGGNDSYFEEFFFPMLYLSEHGFDVYLFEGPGQGGVVRTQNKHFTFQWEKPVKAILDYFSLDDVTIIGASLGGMLAPRAAAFEPRIQRVIAWSVFTNFQEVLLNNVSPSKQRLFKILLKLNLVPVINLAMHTIAKKDELIRWGLNHGMYAYEASTPYEYAMKMNDYQMLNIADKVTQDVFIAGASCDHFIDYRAVGTEISALKNVRSLTFRLFTAQESACNHCNCGNSKLVLDTFMAWIEQIKSKDG